MHACILSFTDELYFDSWEIILAEAYLSYDLQSMNCALVITTNGTYLWSFVTQIFRNGLPNHGGDR
jgi:hypothetical protein